MEFKPRAIPDIQIIPTRQVQPQPEVPSLEPANFRELRVEELPQARSLSAKTQKAYRQDLQQFLNWSDQSWANVTPRQIAQKAHLMRTNLETKQRVLSDATVRRVLGTVKNFFGWMTRSRYIGFDPTTEVELPKLTEIERVSTRTPNFQVIIASNYHLFRT